VAALARELEAKRQQEAAAGVQADKAGDKQQQQQQQQQHPQELLDNVAQMQKQVVTPAPTPTPVPSEQLHADILGHADHMDDLQEIHTRQQEQQQHEQQHEQQLEAVATPAPTPAPTPEQAQQAGAAQQAQQAGGGQQAVAAANPVVATGIYALVGLGCKALRASFGQSLWATQRVHQGWRVTDPAPRQQHTRTGSTLLQRCFNVFQPIWGA